MNVQRAVLALDEVPRREVVVAHELRRANRVAPVVAPDVAGGQREVGDRIVEGPDHRGDLGKSVVVVRDDAVVVGVDDDPLAEAQALAPALVESEHPGSVREASLLEMPEQRVDGRRPGSCRPTDGRADLDDLGVRVAAGEWLLHGEIMPTGAPRQALR